MPERPFRGYGTNRNMERRIARCIAGKGKGSD